MRFHDLRHSHATQPLLAGVHPKVAPFGYEAGRDRGRKLVRIGSADEMPALHDPADLSALPRVVVLALAVTAVRRAGNNEAERIATMSGPERAIGEAAGKQIGEDLRAVEIKHWQIKDHPDHLPGGIDYYSLYQLTTPERVFFFEATHRITRLPGDAIELDISVYPFDKVGNFPYAGRQSSQFSAAEMAYIRDLIADYLRTDREALHPIYAPKERVRSVHVRLP